MRTKPWTVMLGIGLVMIAAYPSLPHGTAQSGAGVVLGVAAVVAIVVGVRRHRPARRLPWLLIAGGQAAYSVGSASWLLQDLLYGQHLFPSYADAFYLCGYPLIVAGLVSLIRVRRPGRDLPALLDAATVATGVVVVVWTFVIGPFASLPGLTAFQRAVILAYPIGDLLVIAVAARLVVGVGARTGAERLLLASLAALLVSDMGYLLGSLNGTYAAGGWVDQGWQLNYLLWGVAALHPSLTTLGEPLPGRVPWKGVRLRLTLMAVASLMPAGVLLVQNSRGIAVDIPVIVAGQVVLFAIVTARMNGLFQNQERLAITDGLTDTYNRRFFNESLGLELKRAQRSGRALGLLVVDVDHFKAVNDEHGHVTGDQVLVEVAARLRRTVRSCDLVARYGGEEFVALLPDAEPAVVAEVAERCRAAIADTPILLPDGALSVTISVGASAYPADGPDEDFLLRVADEALYAAKNLGRNRVHMPGGALADRSPAAT
jgi:two-component system cell cycle response regulator